MRFATMNLRGKGRASVGNTAADYADSIRVIFAAAEFPRYHFSASRGITFNSIVAGVDPTLTGCPLPSYGARNSAFIHALLGVASQANSL